MDRGTCKGEWILMDVKVKVTFLTELIFDNFPQSPLDEMVMSISDAKVLINSGYAVMTQIYD